MAGRQLDQDPFWGRTIPKLIGETAEQIAFVDWLKIKYPNLLKCSIPNDARRSYANARICSRMGLTPGAPDLFIFYGVGGYYGLAIEMKFNKNDLSSYQESFLNQLVENNYAVTVCYCCEYAQQALDDYLKGNLSNAKGIHYYMDKRVNRKRQ